MQGVKGVLLLGAAWQRGRALPPPGLGSGRDPRWLWVGICSCRALLLPDNAGAQGDLHPWVVPGCHGALWGAGVKHRGCRRGSPFVRWCSRGPDASVGGAAWPRGALGRCSLFGAGMFGPLLLSGASPLPSGTHYRARAPAPSDTELYRCRSDNDSHSQEGGKDD